MKNATTVTEKELYFSRMELLNIKNERIKVINETQNESKNKIDKKSKNIKKRVKKLKK